MWLLVLSLFFPLTQRDSFASSQRMTIKTYPFLSIFSIFSHFPSPRPSTFFFWHVCLSSFPPTPLTLVTDLPTCSNNTPSFYDYCFYLFFKHLFFFFSWIGEKFCILLVSFILFLKKRKNGRRRALHGRKGTHGPCVRRSRRRRSPMRNEIFYWIAILSFFPFLYFFASAHGSMVSSCPIGWKEKGKEFLPFTGVQKHGERERGGSKRARRSRGHTSGGGGGGRGRGDDGRPTTCTCLSHGGGGNTRWVKRRALPFAHRRTEAGISLPLMRVHPLPRLTGSVKTGQCRKRQ